MKPRAGIPHLRWYVAGLLFLATTINYLDRQTFSVVAPVLTRELHISEVEYSNIVQAFLIPYTLMYLVSGWFIDRYGTRMGLAVCMAWWSVANALHATAANAFQLGVFRVLLGIGEPGNFVAAVKVISEWYPPKERAFAHGIVEAAASVGAIVAPPLVAWLLLSYGWRPAFLVTGALGFVWLVAWLVLFDLPERHPRITPDELSYISSDQAVGTPAPGEPRIGWLDLLRYRETWGLVLARIVSDPVWWFYLFWLPKYLADSRGFTIAQIGMVAWVPYLASDVGSIVGGLFSGSLIKRQSSVLRARKFAMLAAVALMPIGILIPYAPSATLAIALMCVVTFGHMAWKANLVTLTNDIYPTRIVGTVGGMVGLGSGLGGMLFAYVAGRVIQHSSYTLVFVIMGFLHPIALLVILWFVRRPLMDALSAAPAPLEMHIGSEQT